MADAVGHVMLRRPRTLPVDATTARAVAELSAEHVHMLLLTDGRTLAGTLVATDLPLDAATGVTGTTPALQHARLHGRTVSPAAAAGDVERAMVERGVRRLAVVDEQGALLGLMCLKRRGRGFCSDDDVASRACERAARVRPTSPSGVDPPR